MRKITALTALLALSLSFSTTHAGDRSSLEPQSRSGPSLHWTAYTSETECAAGETVIVVAKDAGVDPVIKSTTPEVHYLGYAGTPTITGSIVGSDLLLAANGLFGKDITWQLRIERA